MPSELAVTLTLCLASVLAGAPGSAQTAGPWPQYTDNPFIFKHAQPADDNGVGGLVVADVNNDGLLDFLLTKPGSVGAYDHAGKMLWVREVSVQVTESSEGHGLPGWHGPGVTAGDVDADDRTEVLFLDTDGRLHVCRGDTGEDKLLARPRTPEPVERWEHLIIANFRGRGDCDILLQACPRDAGYRMGNFLAAFALDDLSGDPLWQTDKYLGCAHNGARIADLDGDGRDEVAGATVFDDDGRPVDAWAYPPISQDVAGGASFHLDSVFIYDVRPDIAGLELVLLEEGRNYVAVANMERGVLWHVHHQRQEPQNAAVGEFDPERPGLEIWCRSRYNEHQKPWVFDAQGDIISAYAMDDVAPAGWTTSGVEVIWRIDWDGGDKHYAAAKERHESGDICIFDPIGGRFIRHWPERADRIFVADLSGDFREEIVVVSGDEVHVYWNDAPYAGPARPRYWTHNWYQRQKMTYNYYSP